MTRRRWIADEVSGNRAALIGEHADHLVRVLRARVGQEFDIATGTHVRRGRIVGIADTRVEFELGEDVPTASPADLTLLLAIFKFDRMEWALEKCTELGVSRIVPVIARRTDAHLVSAADKRVERWRRIVLQAAEQSRRTAPPEVTTPLEMQQAVSLTGSLRIVLAESERQTQLRDLLETYPTNDKPTHYKDDKNDKIVLAVGPEGGWTDEEFQLFHDNEWISASLGPTILRAETAAIAATAIVISELV
jgi:16S rRNA (uracil1498-N3)-methyltransferase